MKLESGYFQLNSKKTYFIFTLCFLVFGMLVALFTSLINYRMQVINIDSALAVSFQNEKEAKLHVLEESFAGLDASLLSIVSNPITRRYVDEQSLANSLALEDFLLGMIASKPIFTQVRLLNRDGMEVIRLNQDSVGHIALTPQAQLQDKSQRYYFREIKQLSPNQHWYSRLDLNIENEQIEFPLRPTIRAAMPLYQDALFLGCIIINVDMSAMLQTLTDSNEFVIFVVDKAGEILYHPEESFAWSRYLAERQSFSALYAGSDKQQYAVPLEEIIDNGEGLSLILTPQQAMLDRMTSNNLYTAFVIAAIVLLISFPLSWLVALFPAGLQKRLSETLKALQRSNQLLDKHVISSRTDKQGLITAVSERMCVISGYSREELIGKTHSMMKAQTPSSELQKALWTALNKGEVWRGEFCDYTKAGDEYWLKSMITPEYDDEQQLIGYAQIAQDITSKKALELLSVTDPLTQLFNRHKLDQILLSELHRFERYQQEFSVMLIDLDHFKRINDTWGHQAGDDTLIKVAQTLKANTRKNDYVGRWGGEEFLIICPSTKLDGAMDLAGKLRLAIEAIHFELQYKVTASIGLATSQENQSVTKLVARADKALYLAKSAGRNQVRESIA